MRTHDTTPHNRSLTKPCPVSPSTKVRGPHLFVLRDPGGTPPCKGLHEVAEPGEWRQDGTGMKTGTSNSNLQKNWRVTSATKILQKQWYITHIYIYTRIYTFYHFWLMVCSRAATPHTWNKILGYEHQPLVKFRNPSNLTKSSMAKF